MTRNLGYGPVVIPKRNYYIKIVIQAAIKTVSWYRDLAKNIKMKGVFDVL